MRLLDHIEYTLLSPYSNQSDFETLIQTAVEYKTFGVCVPPFWVKLANRNLLPGPLKLITVVGFPLGYQKTGSKLHEISEAISDGADEIDLVMNMSAFKSGMLSWIKPEIASASELCHQADVLLKVIIETAYLNEEEIIGASKLCSDAGVDFVKTSTGFATRGASLEDIRLIRNAIAVDCGIKASAGIKTKEFASQLIDAGANRIGSSSHPSIFE